MTERGLDSETCCYQQSKMVDKVQCGSLCQINNYVALDCIYLDEHEQTTKTSARNMDYGLCFRPVTVMTQNSTYCRWVTFLL